MNYFAPRTSAERYAQWRPDFHDEVISFVKNYLKIETKFQKALDVACGTGLSTKALLDIAENVFGIDVSEEMLKRSAKKENLHYLLSKAENIPFGNELFDLLTVSCGVHWFEIEKFLKESKRILKPRAFLILYNNFFIAEIDNLKEFKNWFYDSYLQKYPLPPRDDKFEWNKENLVGKGFDLISIEYFKNPITFTKEQLLLYFTTQSNIVNLVENGQTTYKRVEKWLDDELKEFFPNIGTFHTVYFGNNVKILRRL